MEPADAQTAIGGAQASVGFDRPAKIINLTPREQGFGDGVIPCDIGDDSSPMSQGIARGAGAAAARQKDSYTKGHSQ